MFYKTFVAIWLLSLGVMSYTMENLSVDQRLQKIEVYNGFRQKLENFMRSDFHSNKDLTLALHTLRQALDELSFQAKQPLVIKGIQTTSFQSEEQYVTLVRRQYYNFGVELHNFIACGLHDSSMRATLNTVYYLLMQAMQEWHPVRHALNALTCSLAVGTRQAAPLSQEDMAQKQALVAQLFLTLQPNNIPLGTPEPSFAQPQPIDEEMIDAESLITEPITELSQEQLEQMTYEELIDLCLQLIHAQTPNDNTRLVEMINNALMRRQAF